MSSSTTLMQSKFLLQFLVPIRYFLLNFQHQNRFRFHVAVDSTEYETPNQAKPAQAASPPTIVTAPSVCEALGEVCAAPPGAKSKVQSKWLSTCHGSPSLPPRRGAQHSEQGTLGRVNSS